MGKYVIQRSEIAVVVHTHPARRDHLRPVRDSIEANSDIEDYSLACEQPGLTKYEKMLHWLMFLLLNARLSPYVLRLEDDVQVNKHIIHNLCTWDALRDPEFGCGVLFAHRDNVGEFQRGEFGLVNQSRASKISYAQGHLYESSALQLACKAVWDVLQREGENWKTIDRRWSRFDGTMTLAMGIVGKHIYLHRPSLVDCTEVACIDSLHCRRGPAGATDVGEVRDQVAKDIPHRALDFDPDWRR